MNTSDTSQGESPAPPTWPERRRRAEADCEIIVAEPANGACAARIKESAADPKWEVRKVVAEGLANFPEPLFRELSAIAAGDSNAMVRSAAGRSIARRSSASALSSAHPSVIETELDRIERKYGADARRDAFRLAERTVFLHVRTAVHDIKNILTHLNVDTGALIKLVADKPMKMRLQRLEKGKLYLTRLIGVMETYSREVELTVQAEDLCELLAESIAAACDQVRDEGKDPAPVSCEVRAPASLVIPVSRFHFAMVLTNLIKNAIQSHAVSDSELRPGNVVVEVIKADERLTISVNDTGPGIAPGDLRKLLDFVPGGTSKSAGMGYGLPICRKYIEAHGGELSIRSEEEKGTQVIITLPIQSGTYTL